jgi:hypothetical protein
VSGARGGASAKLLERRLLVHGRQVHTEGGRHATELAPWSLVARERAIGEPPPVGEAMRALEDAAAALGAGATLPWQ